MGQEEIALYMLVKNYVIIKINQRINMRQITINVNPSIYEHIMFFLKNLPSNLIDIHFDNKEEKYSLDTQNNSLKGVFSNYANSEKQALEKDAWKNEILKKYKSNMND